VNTLVDRSIMGDALRISARARPMDVLQTRALVDMSPWKAAEASLWVSTECWTWYEDGEPGAIFGAIEPNILGRRAIIWMMTTPLVDAHRIKFAKGSREVIHRFRETYGRLETEVDARHAVCLRWLAWLGFTIPAPRPYGAAGMPFHRVFIGD
jgi:hypothetical protein